jgi:hypothetical protein
VTVNGPSLICCPCGLACWREHSPGHFSRGGERRVERAPDVQGATVDAAQVRSELSPLTRRPGRAWSHQPSALRTSGPCSVLAALEVLSDRACGWFALRRSELVRVGVGGLVDEVEELVGVRGVESEQVTVDDEIGAGCCVLCWCVGCQVCGVRYVRRNGTTDARARATACRW